MSIRTQLRRRGASIQAVDVHCHVFNAQDIPISGFVKLVYFESNGTIPDWILQLIEFIMRSGAPTASDEIQYLKTHLSGYDRIRPFRSDETETVSEALRLMWLSSPKNRRSVRRHL